MASPFRLALCLALFVGVTTFARPPGPALTARDRALFKWVDTLAIEDFKKAPLVRVRFGYGREDEPRAFLIWEKEGKGLILLGDLTTLLLERNGTDPNEDDYVGWRKVAYAQEVASMEKAFRKKEVDSQADGHDNYTDRLDLKAQLVVLARYGAAHGQEQTAARLMQICRRAYQTKTDRDFEWHLRVDFGGMLEWRKTMAFADPAMDRRKIARLAAEIGRVMPGSGFMEGWDYPAAARQEVAELEKMAAEDEAHLKISSEELAKLPPVEQARELVFRLRDEASGPFDWIRPLSMGWPRPWPIREPQSNGAVRDLNALGMPAVPALLEALADERPSRSVQLQHRMGGSASVDPIQYLACEALEKIAGVHFAWLLDRNHSGFKEEEWNTVRKFAVEWWAAYQAGTEETWLDPHLPKNQNACLEAIAARFPARLMAMVAQGDPVDQARTLARLWELKAPGIRPALLDRLAHSKEIEVRLTAAFGLRIRKDPGVDAVILQEWQTGAARQPPASEQAGRDILNDQLLDYVCTIDSLEAQQSIMDVWTKLSPVVRAETLSRWSSYLRDEHFRVNPYLVYGYAMSVPFEPVGQPTRDALRQFLVQALADDTDGAAEDVAGVKNVTVAEYAARELAEVWPAEFHFALEKNPQKRVAALAKVRAEAARAPATEPRPAH